jgi:hypothetical protein
MKDTRYITLSMENLESGRVEEALRSRSCSMVCLNDTEVIGTEEAFGEAKRRVTRVLASILPHTSGFERQ